jgi:hypothetical protein
MPVGYHRDSGGIPPGPKKSPDQKSQWDWDRRRDHTEIPTVIPVIFSTWDNADF